MSQKIHPFTDRAVAFLKYEPVELNGLVYYPIKVEDYNLWQATKPILTLRQGRLPAVYACMTYLQCVWALQYDAMEQGQKAVKTWDKLAALMFASLRLSDGDTIQPLGDPQDHSHLSTMRITKDGNAFEINAMQFAQVRKLIADLNGAELPDEADNPDLIEAAEDIASSKNEKIKYDFPDMLTSVSSAMGIRRADIMDWTVKEFDDVFRSIKRRIGYVLSSMAESNGSKFKHGNPYPTWIFDKAKDEFAGLIPLERLQAEHKANISVSPEAPDQHL